jgi:hypothetical protein
MSEYSGSPRSRPTDSSRSFGTTDLCVSGDVVGGPGVELIVQVITNASLALTMFFV